MLTAECCRIIFRTAVARRSTTRIDAALWYFEAVRQYFESTQDLELVKKLFPVLSAIVDAHVAGTRYNIKVDPRRRAFVWRQPRSATYLDGREARRLGGYAAHLGNLWRSTRCGSTR